MPFAITWDASFEALPTDSNFMYEIDNYVREVKSAISERMEIDHIWKVGATDGTHKKITLSQVAAPTLAANTMYMYCKDVSAKIELFVMDEDGDEMQITSAGKILSFPSGTKMWFYQNTAPTGWTYDSTPADAVLSVKGGTAAYNAAGGTKAGTWALTGLNTGDVTLSAAQSGVPAHHHHITGEGNTASNTPTYLTTGHSTVTSASFQTGNNDTAAAASPHAHTIAAADTWRPAAQIGIICTKD